MHRVVTCPACLSVALSITLPHSPSLSHTFSHIHTQPLASAASLRPFFQEDFDAAAFLRHALVAPTAAATASAGSLLERLRVAVAHIEQTLRAQVVQNHGELLRHSGHIDSVEEKLQAVSQRITAMHHTVQKCVTAILFHLFRLHHVCHVLECVTHLCVVSSDF